MAKRLNSAQVLAVSNIGAKRDGAGSNYTEPTIRQGGRARLTKGQNCGVVENKDSHLPCTSQERAHYGKQMTELCGDQKVPAVLYKGKTIPRRVLSEFGYLTKG